MRELTVYFGAERNLIGTLTFRDENADIGDLGVVLTNAGVIPRTGLHGINVTLARALARIGLPSIRFDKSGLGDSGRPSKGQPTEQQQSILETRLAMDEAQSRHGVRRFAMIGFCSGADDAYWTALQDERICSLLLWDPYIYPTLKSKIVHFSNVIRERGVVDAVGRTLRAGARALRTRSEHRKMRATGEEAPAQPVRFGRSYIPPAAEYAAGIRRLLDRGVEIKIVYSGGFSESYNYASQYRDSFKGFGIADRISCLYLRQADHSLTSGASQQALLQTAVEWLKSFRTGSELPVAPPG